MSLAAMMETSVVPFEQRLKGDLQGALAEGSLYFEERGSVWQTCRRIAAMLDGAKIAYTITGALALFRHGYRRFTPNVNLLVAADDFKRASEQKPGFVRPPHSARNLLDDATGVRVHFVKSSEYLFQ
jgi:hypothetical protein